MAEAVRIGLTVAVDTELHRTGEVVLLRCVNDRGEKFTALGDAGHLRHLLESGEARDPDGMKLRRQSFPFVARGWLRPNEEVGQR